MTKSNFYDNISKVEILSNKISKFNYSEKYPRGRGDPALVHSTSWTLATNSSPNCLLTRRPPATSQVSKVILRNNVKILSTLEKYPRGRRGSPAKGVVCDKRSEGSNPSFSAKSNSFELFMFRRVFFYFFKVFAIFNFF